MEIMTKASTTLASWKMCHQAKSGSPSSNSPAGASAMQRWLSICLCIFTVVAPWCWSSLPPAPSTLAHAWVPCSRVGLALWAATLAHAIVFTCSTAEVLGGSFLLARILLRILVKSDNDAHSNMLLVWGQDLAVELRQLQSKRRTPRSAASEHTVKIKLLMGVLTCLVLPTDTVGSLLKKVHAKHADVPTHQMRLFVDRHSSAASTTATFQVLGKNESTSFHLAFRGWGSGKRRRAGTAKAKDARSGVGLHLTASASSYQWWQGRGEIKGRAQERESQQAGRRGTGRVNVVDEALQGLLSAT